jgi:hypothetical protein
MVPNMDDFNTCKQFHQTLPHECMEPAKLVVNFTVLQIKEEMCYFTRIFLMKYCTGIVIIHIMPYI